MPFDGLVFVRFLKIFVFDTFYNYSSVFFPNSGSIFSCDETM
jgi:hypothetical protein